MVPARHQKSASAERSGEALGEAGREPGSDEAGTPRHETGNTGSALLRAALTRENLRQAFKRVRANKGAAGVDGLDIDQTAFEAANRIMTDLVILYGVKWLLESKTFPFDSYTVEFGKENKNDFDIQARSTGKLLVGEAFNVAPSFFQSKKSSMLKKLRKKPADYLIIMVNHDVVTNEYSPYPKEGEYYVFVNVDDGTAKVVPKNGSGRFTATAEPSRILHYTL